MRLYFLGMSEAPCPQSLSNVTAQTCLNKDDTNGHAKVEKLRSPPSAKNYRQLMDCEKGRNNLPLEE